MLATFHSITTTVGARLSLKSPGKAFYLFVLALLIVATGALALYRLVYLPSQTVQASSTMQTATVRQGDITLSATGSGTLTAPEEDLTFTAGGEMFVTAVDVKAGDLVQAGDVLAEVDSSDAQAAYDEAKQKYLDLTSTTAAADAAQAIASDESELQSAMLQLEYLISPDVMYWELQMDDAVAALKKAQDAVYASPTVEATQKALEKAQAFLSFADSGLAEAKLQYTKEYVPATFPIAIDGDTDTYLVPTEMEVKQARAAINDAKANLAEDQELYAVLNGQPMPEETSSESLLAIKEAKSNMDQAKARLDGTQIIAPFAGTIMQVNIAGGDTVAVGSTDNNVIDATKAIVIDDTSNPYLEVYWNESDWSMVKVSKAVEITFDDLSDQVYSGTITEVDSRLAVSNGSNVVRGEVSLNASYADLSLPIGATATVEAVNQRADNAVFIPIEALHEYSSGEYAVFVLTDGEPAIRTVEVGLKTAEYAQITSGLEAGEVVTTGITKTK